MQNITWKAYKNSKLSGSSQTSRLEPRKLHFKQNPSGSEAAGQGLYRDWPKLYTRKML